MKLRNILFSLIAVLSTMFGITVKASTTAPNNFYIDAKDLYLIDGSYYLKNSTLKFSYKENTDGKVVYCTEIHDSMVSSGTEKYTLNKELDSRFVYVLENGYPQKSITGNKNKDYFITGLAVWYLIAPNDTTFTYFDFTNGTYRGESSDIAKEVAKLVNGSKNYSNIDPTMKISISDNNLTLSSDKKYYTSSSIRVTTTGKINNNSYTVSLENAPKGTIITDANGKEKTTFTTNEKFLVKVPTSSINTLNAEFKINVSATGSINRAYSYSPDHSYYQSTATIYPENKELKDSTTLKISVTTEVQISKIDATTGKELPGAKLILESADGSYKDSWISTNEPKVIKGLKPGKYYLTEEYAPEGYILSSEKIEFEIKTDGAVVKVVMKNSPEDVPNSPIYISKKDITTGEELPGAHLELKDEKGNLIEAWISSEESHPIEGLEPGKYYLTETLAPEGYELSTETVEFTVKEDGTVDGEIVMYNKPETYIPVPSTSSFKTITASLIGIVIIGLGAMIIYKNYKKNEEN